jgi:hypothetical protein
MHRDQRGRRGARRDNVFVERSWRGVSTREKLEHRVEPGDSIRSRDHMFAVEDFQGTESVAFNSRYAA